MRLQQSPWLTDHVIFFCYRWITWLIAAQVVLWLDYPSEYGWILLFGAILNLGLTWFAQPYQRIAHNHPFLLVIDLIIMISMQATIVQNSDNRLLLFFFLPYALSSIILPGLIWGWQGGVISGLAFVVLDRLTSFSASLNQTGSETAWYSIFVMMIVPPLWGVGFPLLIERIRQRNQQRKQDIVQQHWAVFDEHDESKSSEAPDLFSYTKSSADDLLAPFDRSLPLRNQPVRTVEPNTEALRRRLFTPLPSSDMPFSEIIETLILRFAQQSSVNARFTLLGKPQTLSIASHQVLIRLVQEALLNVQQHAQANSLVCTLRYDNSSVVLLVQDNGIGLPNGSYERPGLHALRAMYYRLGELGGRLDVFDTQGGGVTVRASIPIDTPNTKT
jgi:glucose-6-phosphate-specific signal transduction histidine kinase